LHPANEIAGRSLKVKATKIIKIKVCKIQKGSYLCSPQKRKRISGCELKKADKNNKK
jgi:hypothetical protein